MRQFFDSNVVLYLLSDNQTKANCCEEIVEQGGVISVQVLNECVNVMLKKLTMARPEIDEFLAVIKSISDIVPLSVEVHEGALELLDKYQLSWYDALIVSAAIESDCDTLWSEDMHNGLVVNKTMTIRIPFNR